MASFKLNVTKLDKIIKKTIEAIENSKQQIYDIAESSRREYGRLKEELEKLKQQAKELIETVDVLEAEMKKSKRRLMLVSKNFHQYSQEELKEAYEKADRLRVELAVKREQEQQLIRRRNELEVRIKDAAKTVEKADDLILNIGAALGYLKGDLKDISLQLEDLQQRQVLGLRIIRAQEEERLRLAGDIHDGPAQSMSNVVLKAEICERLMDVDLEKVREELQNLKKLVRGCLQDVRKIIYNLRPMSLDDLGLIPTLQRYITTFQEESGIAVSFKTNGVYSDIDSVISLTIFRVVQEAINNIKKHAQAQNVAINLDFTGNEVKVYVFDDGKGFNVEDMKVKEDDINSGFGLASMKERVELLNGRFTINSQPGRGTRLNVAIPLIKEEGKLNG